MNPPRHPPIAPKPSYEASASSSRSGESQSRGKRGPPAKRQRQLNAHACFACQKRKSKCDGNRPTCGRCLAKKTQCDYEFASNLTRTAGLREKLKAVTAQKSDLEYLVARLKISCDEETSALINRLRSGVQVHDIVKDLRGSQDRCSAQSPSATTVSADYPSSDDHRTSVVESEDDYSEDDYEEFAQMVTATAADQLTPQGPVLGQTPLAAAGMGLSRNIAASIPPDSNSMLRAAFSQQVDGVAYQEKFSGFPVSDGLSVNGFAQGLQQQSPMPDPSFVGSSAGPMWQLYDSQLGGEVPDQQDLPRPTGGNPSHGPKKSWS